MRFRLADRISLGVGCMLMAIVYFMVHSAYGIDLHTQGQIEAFAWRIQKGQIPYQDFMYPFPPFSAYFHSLFSNFSTVVCLERFVFYLMISLSVLFSTRSLQAFFDFRSLGVSPLIFSFIAFVYSVHNYPPSASPTVDGLFFASLGIYLFTKTPYGFIYGLFGLISILISALCHYVFWPILILGPIMLYMLYPDKKSNWAISLFLSLSGLFLIGFAIFRPEFLKDVWQSVCFLSGKDLYIFGIKPYAKPLLIWVLPLLIVWLIKMNYTLRGIWKDMPAVVFWIFFFGMLGAHITKAMKTGMYVPPSFGFSQAMLLLALGVTLRTIWLQARASYLLLGMLLVCWCVSLDRQYPYPMLYSAPVLFCFFKGLYGELEFRMPRYFYGIALFVIYWIFAVLYQYPYGDDTRSKIDKDMGELYPSLTGIYSGPLMYEQTQEIQNLQKEYEGTFTILPAFPLFHMLNDRLSSIPFDDINYISENEIWNRERIVNSLNENCQFILIDKHNTDTLLQIHWLLTHIKTSWDMVEEGEYFDIYEK